MKKMRKIVAPTKITPPIIPPTMAPVLEDIRIDPDDVFFDWLGVGEVLCELVMGSEEDTAVELKDRELLPPSKQLESSNSEI
jgi:hypothetical protein